MNCNFYCSSEKEKSAFKGCILAHEVTVQMYKKIRMESIFDFRFIRFEVSE